MYQRSDGLGFSLKPPKVVRDLVAQLISKTKVTVPTTTGTVVFTGSQTPAPQPVQAGFMDDMSGSGNTTMLLVGAGLLALLLLKRRG